MTNAIEIRIFVPITAILVIYQYLLNSDSVRLFEIRLTNKVLDTFSIKATTIKKFGDIILSDPVDFTLKLIR